MIHAGEPYLDLGLGAILIGAEEEADVDVERALSALDDLAESAEGRLKGHSVLQRVASLVEHLFVHEGFRGNREDYLDPMNSLMHQVLRRKTGIPITLSIVLIEVARRLGVSLDPVGFPTHFLVGIRDAPGLFVDPFNEGRILTVAECSALLHVNTGGVLAFERGYLSPTPTAEVLARVSRNLKAIHLKGEHLESALRASERILMLRPGDWSELRERGVIQFRLGAYGPAIEDLSTYLREVPHGDDRAWIEDMIEQGRRRLS